MTPGRELEGGRDDDKERDREAEGQEVEDWERGGQEEIGYLGGRRL